MKKRTLSILLALCMVLSLLPAEAQAASSGSCGSNVYWELDDSGTLTISGNGAMDDYMSTSSIPWFDSNITAIRIEDGVTHIGEKSFWNCTKVTSVSIANSVSSIGGEAFASCGTFRGAPIHITIPASMTVIGDWAFYGCYMGSVSIHSNVTSIGDSAFYACSYLTQIDIPASVTSIGEEAFRMCERLEAVTIPESVTSIGWWAFTGCPVLHDIYFGGTQSQWDRMSPDLALGSSTPTVHCLKAEPEPEQTYSVTFDANGGSVRAVAFNLKNGDTYGTLPIPDREGYVFDGWYTAPSGGQQVRDGDTVSLSKDQILYAHWTAQQRYTVTFDPNGGYFINNGQQSSSASKQVLGGQAYGELPTPTRASHSFDGWYTAPSGGARVTDSTVVSLSGDQVLYAHWTSTVHKPSVSELSYSFGNSSRAYGYASGYRIPLERYQLIFGNTALAQALYNRGGAWGGNCYGMSATSSMFFQDGNGVSTGSFASGAARPSALSTTSRNSSWNLTVQEFIEAMQISQSSAVIQSDYQNNKNQLSQLVQAVKAFNLNGTDPVVIAVFGLDNRGNQSGHALVGYDVVDVSGTESRLMVYDCNYPNDAGRYITLTKNSYGQYTGWYYYLNNSYNWGSGYPSSWISYVPYSHFFASWQNRQGGNGVNLLTLNTENAVIKDINGEVAATIRNGEVTANRSGIYPVINIGLLVGEEAAQDVGAAVWLPTDDLYTVTNTDASTTNFEATMVHVDQSASVTTSGSEITFAVDDSTQLNYVELPNEAGIIYDISLNSTLGQGYGDVQLSGMTGAGSAAVLAQIEGRLYANGADLNNGASLRVNGAAASSSILAGTMPQISSILNPSTVSFVDVPADAWYRNEVAWAVERGITEGTGNNTFTPGRECTHGEIVTMLWRANGKPAADRTAPLSVSSWYAEAVNWAYERGIIDGSFQESAPCTRADTVSYMWKAAGRPAVSQAVGFTDVPSGAAYLQAVNWAVANGITKGTGTGETFAPYQTCTRSEIVTFLYRGYK